MRKRIYRNMWGITIISVFVLTLILTFAFYNFYDGQTRAQVRTEADFFQKNLGLFHSTADDIGYLNGLKLTKADDRITVISPEGAVLYDSYEAPKTMEAHLDRPEVKEALETGTGEDMRTSRTLGEKTYYYALKLDDGNIMRVAKTTGSIYHVFLRVVPLIALWALVILLLCGLIAKRLTRRIVNPINALDTDNADAEIYEELAPFIRTILHQREQIKQNLQDLESRAVTIRSITENMREGLIMLDTHGTVISSNRSAGKILNSQDAVGKNIIEMTRDISILEHINTAMEGSGGDMTIEQGGETYQVFFSPVYEDDTICGVNILFLDITDRANAEKMRREFAANVSHELKTPLTTILGLSEMIDSGIAKSEDVPAFVRKIKSEATRLISLVEDIIKLSELDEKAHGKQGEDVNLLTLVKGVAESLKEAAAERNVTVTAGGEDAVLRANRRMMEELLFNLADNGVKYNRDGGRVDIACTPAADGADIVVSDTGIGIPEAHLGRIFERFYRVDKSRSKKTGGTGLGLSIVKHIAQYHNGTVEITSEEGAGTTIRIHVKNLE